MGVKLSIESEESPRQVVGKIVGVLLLALICLIMAMMVTLALAHLATFGMTPKSLAALEGSWLKILQNPLNLFTFYGYWWDIFIQTLGQGRWRWALFLPLLAPLIAVSILFLAYIRSSYSFSLWYLLYHHFAKLKDVKRMGLMDGTMLVLGRFQEQMLGINQPGSILCFGEAGGGKTSSVAIPSILYSDNCSIIAVDNSGTLAKYTSGYRATLGKVFYFNWDLEDEPDKENYYPRWNPLAAGNLPVKGEQRDNYLKFLAEFLLASETRIDKENYWGWLSFSSMYAFLQFLTAKISQATANDYFLNQILEKNRLTKEDKDILLSFYALMPKQYGEPAIKNINKAKLTVDDYFPIGSWDGIMPAWQGKELCLAMVTDWLIVNYLESRSETTQGIDWKDWLESLLSESYLFNYGNEAMLGLQQLSYLSRQQRRIVLPMIIKPLKVFRNRTVRERTCGNDFNMMELRGMKNPETKCWEPVTIYCTANTKSTKFVSRLFMEILLRQNLTNLKFKGPFPLLVVMDDVGQMMEVRTLCDAVSKGPRYKMSTLLLCNSLNNLKSIYGREALEDIVTNTNYKIVLGEDNQKLSRQLDKLAVFGTRAVQIPADKRVGIRIKKGHANSNYYHRLAKSMKARRNLSITTRGFQLLLVEGYYHCPVLSKNIHFLKEEKFKRKALLGASYGLDKNILCLRNHQDNEVPSGEEILYGEGRGIDDEVDLDIYMNSVYDEVYDKVQQTPDRKTVLAEEISTRWSTGDKLDKPQEDTKSTADGEGEWWLDESAFTPGLRPDSSNPFAKK